MRKKFTKSGLGWLYFDGDKSEHLFVFVKKPETGKPAPKFSDLLIKVHKGDCAGVELEVNSEGKLTIWLPKQEAKA